MLFFSFIGLNMSEGSNSSNQPHGTNSSFRGHFAILVPFLHLYLQDLDFISINKGKFIDIKYKMFPKSIFYVLFTPVQILTSVLFLFCFVFGLDCCSKYNHNLLKPLFPLPIIQSLQYTHN